MTNDEKRAIIAAATHGLKNIDRQNWCDPRSFAEFIAAIKERDRQIWELRQRLEDLERLEALEKENAELKELIKRIWLDDYDRCQYCGGYMNDEGLKDGHYKHCKIAPLLREG